MAIQSEIVRDVVGLYETWFDRRYPSTDWTCFRDRAQDAIDNCPATIAYLPRMRLRETRDMPGIPTGNPLKMEPELLGPKCPDKHARYAGQVAQKLYNAGHPVFYVNRALSLGSAQFKGLDVLLGDIFAYAPVLVYHESVEAHKHGWVRDMLITRRWGITFFIREVGNEK